MIFYKRPIQAADPYGNEEGEWAEQFTLWARISPVKGRITTFLGEEEVIAQKLTAVQPVIIKVRWGQYSRLIQTSWKVVWTRIGTEFNILSIANPDEKNKFLEMLAQAGTATG